MLHIVTVCTVCYLLLSCGHRLLLRTCETQTYCNSNELTCELAVRWFWGILAYSVYAIRYGILRALKS